MAEASKVFVNLRPLREQIEAMSKLLKSGDPDKPELVKALDDAAKRIKDVCGGMGVNVTFK